MKQIKTRERVKALGEVFTGPNEVRLMLDMLNGDAENPDCRILEPSCGDGNFLVEIVRRRSSSGSPVRAVEFVYGVDICPENVHEARSRVCSVLNELFPEEMSGSAGAAALEIITQNIRIGDFLAQPSPECDVIIGNPPYQEMDGGFGSSARPLYHRFVMAARALAKKKVCLIIPARWYSGGKGLADFRKAMLADRSVATIVDWEDASIPFPGVDISGGICVILIDKAHEGRCVFEARSRGGVGRALRDLREADVLIRDNAGAAIARKAMSGRKPLSDVVRPRNSFGMATNFVATGRGAVRVMTNAGWVNHDPSLITKRRELINKWKVFVSGSAFEHAGVSGKDGKRRVLSRVFVAPPGTAATETYILIDAFDDESRARNLCALLKTRTVRYLVSLAAGSHHITRDRFRFVPQVDVERGWDDEALARLFRLMDDEKRVISQAIRDWPAE